MDEAFEKWYREQAAIHTWNSYGWAIAAWRAAIAKERERIKDILSRSLTDDEKYKLIDEGG